MRRLPVVVIVLGALLLGPSAAAADTAACPSRDAHEMLRAAGQGFNGRVEAVRADRIVVLVESRYDGRSIAFGAHVTVHGTALPATLDGRIGIAVRRQGGRWRATPCDVIPAARMARALAGLAPCPAPRVRIDRVETTGREVAARVVLGGDVTGLRLRWGDRVRRRVFEPGVTMIVERLRFATPGTSSISARVQGGSGPGCGTARLRFAAASRTVTVR